MKEPVRTLQGQHACMRAAAGTPALKGGYFPGECFMQAAPCAGPPLRAEFEDSDQLGQSEWREGTPFDAITCMFAIHYFFVSERALDTFLGNVVANLKEGAEYSLFLEIRRVRMMKEGASFCFLPSA